MPCNPTTPLTGVSYSCEDAPIGGIKRLIIGRVKSLDYTVTDGALVFNTAPASGDVVEIEFNNKDAYSNFVEDKSVEASGIVKNVPVVQVELPKMTKTKRNAIESLTKSGDALVAFIETSAGEYQAIGWEYGLYGSAAHGQSGNGRSEKNVYQLTLTGEESQLGAFLDATEWAKVVAGL